MEARSKREEIIEVTNKLFVYTDHRQWDKLLSEVFTNDVYFDMESLGAGPGKSMTGVEICNAWNEGFNGIDAIHHQAGNHIVKFRKEEIEAEVFCYAIALHYKSAATLGKTREFIGSYELGLVLTDEGWRMNSFKYNVKYINGNADLK